MQNILRKVVWSPGRRLGLVEDAVDTVRREQLKAVVYRNIVLLLSQCFPRVSNLYGKYTTSLPLSFAD